MGHAPHRAAARAFDATAFAGNGPYDRAKLLAGFDREFGTGFAATTHEDVDAFVTLTEQDAAITDLRWTAYMLATVHLEAKVLVDETITTDRKGRPLKDKKGNPIQRIVHKWHLLTPVEEGGHGAKKDYYEPVKVALQTDGTLLVTEHDGDQFNVDALGNIRNFDASARGATYREAASTIYTKAPGIANSYFGRGYVQLTWWDGYLRAGKELGMGTDLLTDPAKALDPAIAYKLMAYGMRTGKIFANGFTFARFFTGTGSDYVGARKMVNGSNRNIEIAAIARKYEAILLASKPTAVVAPAPAIPLPGRP